MLNWRLTDDLLQHVSIKPNETAWTSKARSSGARGQSYEELPKPSSSEYVLSRGGTELHLHPEKGLVSVTRNGVTYNISQGYYYYESHAGDNHDFEHRASGAYIFRW